MVSDLLRLSRILLHIGATERDPLDRRGAPSLPYGLGQIWQGRLEKHFPQLCHFQDSNPGLTHNLSLMLASKQLFHQASTTEFSNKKVQDVEVQDIDLQELITRDWFNLVNLRIASSLMLACNFSLSRLANLTWSGSSQSEGLCLLLRSDVQDLIYTFLSIESSFSRLAPPFNCREGQDKTV